VVELNYYPVPITYKVSIRRVPFSFEIGLFVMRQHLQTIELDVVC